MVKRNQSHKVLSINKIGRRRRKNPLVEISYLTRTLLLLHLHPATEHHPVTKLRNPDARRGAIAAVQWYIPPSVGYEETNSARDAPKNDWRMKTRRKPYITFKNQQRAKQNILNRCSPAPGPPALISATNPKPRPVQEIVVVDARPIRLRIPKCLFNSC